jgi:hypothetical protein
VSPMAPAQPHPPAASPGNAPSSGPAQAPERAQAARRAEGHGPPQAIVHSQAPAEQDRGPKRAPPNAAANGRPKDKKEKKEKNDKDDRPKN